MLAKEILFGKGPELATVEDALIFLIQQVADLLGQTSHGSAMLQEQLDALNTKIKQVAELPRPSTMKASKVTLTDVNAGVDNAEDAYFALTRRADEIAGQVSRNATFFQEQLTALRANQTQRVIPATEASKVVFASGSYNLEDVNGALNYLLAQVDLLKTRTSKSDAFVQEQLTAIRDAATRQNRPRGPMRASEIMIFDGGGDISKATTVQDALASLRDGVTAASSNANKAASLLQDQVNALRLSIDGKIQRMNTKEAQGIAFRDDSSNGFATVHDALNWAEKQILLIKSTDAERESQIAKQAGILFDLTQKIEKQLLLYSNRLDQHDRIFADRAYVISSASNPAIKFDSDGRFVLDLDQAGSFDDTVAALGVNTIQQAIEVMAERAVVSPKTGNQLVRDGAGKLYVPEQKITLTPALYPVTVQNGILNLSPAVIAHRRGQVVLNTVPDTWETVTELETRVWDTLSEVGLAMTPLSAATVVIRRNGYYLIETDGRGEVETSIVLNGVVVGVNRTREVLQDGDIIEVAVRVGGDGSYTGQIDLFVQLIS